MMLGLEALSNEIFGKNCLCSSVWGQQIFVRRIMILGREEKIKTPIDC